MATATLVPVEEYLRFTGKPNAEYRDGVVQRKPMPTTLHGMIEFLLALLLHRQGLEVATEVSVRLTETKFLVPDVIAAKALQQPYPTEPVLICCEILSPDDKLGATLGKCEEYHAWGTPYCWVIDPVKQTAWEYPAGGEPLRASEVLHAGEYEVHLSELFAH